MRLSRSRHTWLILFAPFALALAAAPSGHAEPDPKELVRRLGHDQYPERERAAEELQKLGDKAIPAVRDGLTDADPEIRTRTQTLLFAILLAVGKSKSTDIQLRPVRGREFVMGSAKNEPMRRPDEDEHKVRITKAFLVGTHEVTQAQFEKVTKRNPSWFSKVGGGRDRVPGDTGRYPVEQVTWFDAVDFCNRLSELDGIKPFYKLTDVKTGEGGAITSAAVEALGGGGYRLPTEAEWEYACRGLTDTRFHYGRNTGRNSLNAKVFIASSGYGSSSETIHLNRAATVGSYARNPFGLYDMHGNVGEWCGDWYDRDYYANSPVEDPPGPKTGTHKVLRGGSWLIADTSCRSAARAMHPPGDATYFTGFRVARSP